MSHKDSFGLRLRAARERQGVSLESIVQRTKVPTSLWEAMERNDFSRWPSGLFARSYVRDYATAVGLNAEEIVDEFCRYFPNGDRRRGNLVRAQADVIDIRSQFQEEQLPPGGDRRASAAPPEHRLPRLAEPRWRRALGAAGDAVCVGALAAALSQVPGSSFLVSLGLVSLAYFTIGSVLFGHSPGIAFAELLGRRVPQLVPPVERRRIHA